MQSPVTYDPLTWDQIKAIMSEVERLSAGRGTITLVEGRLSMPVGAFLDLMTENDQLGAMCAAYDEKFKLQREIVCHAMAWRLCDEAQPSPHEGPCQHLDDMADACDALTAEQSAAKP